MMITYTQEELSSIVHAFAFPGTITDWTPHGNGHINDTFLVRSTENGVLRKSILQRMNRTVFHNPTELMLIIARYLEQNPEIIVVQTYIDNGATGTNFHRPGFQQMLSDFPSASLFETIPDFHNTPLRYQALLQAVQADPKGRLKNVSDEMAFFLDHADDYGVAERMKASGELPLRVTHNDTKLNNIMIDDKTGEGICVIDLDTIMPGLSIFDFGDSIRFGANTAAEDEQDVSKVSLSLPLFESYTKGFLAGCAGSLTRAEVEMLPMGAKLMTLECGIRFLADYLMGDTYFKTAYPEHNLVRARTQIALVADMEEKWGEMENIVARASFSH